MQLGSGHIRRMGEIMFRSDHVAVGLCSSLLSINISISRLICDGEFITGAGTPNGNNATDNAPIRIDYFLRLSERGVLIMIRCECTP